MSTASAAYIARIHEHPIRRADGLSTAQMHADVARGVLENDPVTLRFVPTHDGPPVPAFTTSCAEAARAYSQAAR
ncbi:hypothetical protein [Paraburkholderia youngii]|uniref:hypothetical protein n=1 Tax=Paraburkholderia youngii TaxID=2782701 RepID=UPI003D252B63